MKRSLILEEELYCRYLHFGAANMATSLDRNASEQNVRNWLTDHSKQYDSVIKQKKYYPYN